MEAAAIVQRYVAMVISGFGCLGNTFIILVFLLEYRRSQTLQPYELIITLLAVCSIITELVFFVRLAIYVLNFCTYYLEPVFKATDFILTFFPKSLIWLTAWLCFVYCMKIVKVNWRFFMKLKQRISLVVNLMIIGTALLCFAISFPIIFRIRFRTNSTNMCKQYFIATDQKEISVLYTGMLSLLTSFLPLVLMLVSSLGIIIFLCRHSRNMDKISTSSNSSHTDAHMVVATTLICLIALFIACAGTALPVNMQIASGHFDAVIAVTLAQLIYSAGSPVILIIGTVKLRKSFGKLCCLRK
ncbi:taste receptor type 2 member 40-like [Latimeria chalumnae]|uniref:taste receptor type 2 member 40-like n=1 Tax=Latimeria chalumnae TaxID=7897 RepID=UPI00313EC221